MVTRFSATEARLKAEQAKKAIEEQRLKEKVWKKQRAQEVAALKTGFDTQRLSIISAALDGDTEIEVGAVFFFRDLVGLGVQVVEEGLVKRQAEKSEDSLDPNIREQLRSEILDRFDHFIDAAKGDLKGYYDGLKRFHRLNYDALHEALNSGSDWSEFHGDDVYCLEVPDNLKSKYSDYFDHINEKIREYKGASEDDDYEDEYDEDDEELITGEYCFSDEDEEIDVLRPSVEGNKLKIRWTSEEGSTFMNAPLLSDTGLAWLSTYRGQSLVEEVFDALSAAAESGKSSTKLDFSLSKDGWYFLASERKIFSCMPDELVDIIARENFSIESALQNPWNPHEC
jgi:hypothetical protein